MDLISIGLVLGVCVSKCGQAAEVPTFTYFNIDNREHCAHIYRLENKKIIPVKIE